MAMEKEEILNTSTIKVLIVGAGIAGLSASIALNKIGISAELVERRKAFKHEGAGIGIPANATWALKELGLLEPLLEQSIAITDMEVRTDQNELLAKADLTQIHNSGAQFRALHRATLHKLLLSKVPKSQIRMGISVNKINKTENGSQVQVIFTDDSTGCYDLIIGADGINSVVRQELFGKENRLFYGVFAWRTIVNPEKKLERPIYMLGDDTVFMLYPIENSQTYIYCHKIVPENFVDCPEFRLDKIRDIFKDFKGLVPEYLQYINDSKQIFAGRIEAVSSIAWSKLSEKIPIILIGDASHASSPRIQQGGAQAIEDAYVLGQELKRGLNEQKSIFKILEAVVDRRHERVQWVYDQSNQNPIDPQSRNDLINLIKERGMPNVNCWKVLMAQNP